MDSMTRKQMEAEMDRTGGSIMIGRRIISRKEQLPSEEDLAKGNPEREASVRRDLARQLAEIQLRLNRMNAPAGEVGQRSGSPIVHAIPEDEARGLLREMERLQEENRRLREGQSTSDGGEASAANVLPPPNPPDTLSVHETGAGAGATSPPTESAPAPDAPEQGSQGGRRQPRR